MSLQTISSEKNLNFLSRKSVIWKHLTSFDDFNSFVAEIDEIKVNRGDEKEIITEWFITIRGVPFTWLEIDSLNINDDSLHFEAVSGDFDQWSGVWKIEQLETGYLKLVYSLNYHLGVPVIENIIDNVLQEKLQLFSDNMVEAHCKKLNGIVCDERQNSRIKINKNITFVADEKALSGEILDISQGGMLLRLKKGMLSADLHKIMSFSFVGFTIDGQCAYEKNTDSTRIVFTHHLTSEMFDTLLLLLNSETFHQNESVKVFDVFTAKKTIANPSIHLI
jgi:ribosome-associated toxin RatA of RatAB toxin-antitoxin module